MRGHMPNPDSHLALLRQCVDHCRATLFDHCLPTGGAHVAPEHVERMMDCIEICRTAIDFMTRGSAQHGLVCGTCAEICLACADSCEQLDDAIMSRCADICRRCAEGCIGMAEASGRPFHHAA